MIEAIVEGGGIVAGLGLLLYYQVLRPDPALERLRAERKARGAAPEHAAGVALDPPAPEAPDRPDVR